MGKLGNMIEIGRSFGVRDGMLRLGYEFQRGSGLMSRRMRSAQGWQSWDLRRIAPGTEPRELLDHRRAGKNPFFFHDARSLEPSLGAILTNGEKQKIQAEARNTLAGDLPFFGRLSFATGFPPQWFQNPVTGERVSPKQSWTRLRFASRAYGDLKFILEPSRFLFVYPLVRAYALTGDDRFPDAFWMALEDWTRNSPPMSGPLWVCGQECSLRILAWTFAFYGFLNSPVTSQDRAALLLSTIAAHAWRIAQSLNYARSQRSNHLISEAVGLWTVGTLFPELEDAAPWQRLGARLLCESVLDQITPEGVSHQHSFNYQRMILHLLLWTVRLAGIHDAQLDPSIRERAARALEFLRTWVDPVSGHTPNYGSNDGSHILPLTSCEYGDFRPLLQLGAAVLGQSGMEPGPWNEAALWLCGKSPAPEQRGLPLTTPETGYHRLGDENSWALVRAGRYVRRPFQADQLHVDLWWRGLNLARDSGTYLYNGEPPWNNGLARTVVHNTVTVDGRDQMRRAGRFLWVDWAQASGHSSSYSAGDSADYFEGQHDGYKRCGVEHRRIVRCLPDAGWVIIDDLLGAGEHDLRLQWLVPDLSFEVSNSPFRVLLRSERQEFSFNIFSSHAGKSAIVRAGATSAPEIAGPDLPLLGWESPTYAELRPAVSLLYRTQGQLPVRFVTAVLADQKSRTELKADQLTIWRDDLQLFQVGVVPNGNAK